MSSQPSSSSYTRRCCPRWSSRRMFMLRLLKKSSSSFVQYIVFVCYSRESSLKVCLDSSPCPRRPPPPLILSIVALRGRVRERGKPGAHQAGHHLSIVVVVASSLSRQNWNIRRLLRLVESLAWKTLQHVGWDPGTGILRLCHNECWKETDENKANHSHVGFGKPQQPRREDPGVSPRKQGLKLTAAA